jgi:hypothetical protein
MKGIKRDWEDERWKKDYQKEVDELDVSKPKPKKPLLVWLKIVEPLAWNRGKYKITKFGEKVKTFAIVMPVIILVTFLGIRQWTWYDETVWGQFDGSSRIYTEYGALNCDSDWLSGIEKGTLIPLKVRKRVTRNPKPWRMYSGFNVSPVAPMRVNWKLFMEDVVKGEFDKYF